MGSIAEPSAYYVEPADIPTVDYRSLNGTIEERKAALEKLDDSFRTHGFVYLSNHGIPNEAVREAFQWSQKFFKLPLNVKDLISHPPSGEADDHRGFAREGLAHVSQMVFDRDAVQVLRNTHPERKETLEIGNPYATEVPPNRWLPEDVLPGFKKFVESWWDRCTDLNHSLLRSLAEVLNLEDIDHLSKRQSRDICHMSWAHYPSMPLKPLQNQDFRRLNAHTDFGQLTLVFQDMIGGLEVQDGDIFRPVVPKPDTVVLNVGDMLERQSNGRWKSALHRVVAPGEFMIPRESEKQVDEVEAVVDRYALVYFGTPNPESIVETLPGCEEKGRWVPNMIGEWGDKMTAEEWVAKRLAVEY